MNNIHNHDQVIEKETVEEIIKNQIVRREITRRCHYWFFRVYFPQYMEYQMANFHKELFALTEDRNVKKVVIEAFRGSGKTTIMGMSYAIWSILGAPQKKCIVLLAQTESQARMYLANIKKELEANTLLLSDLGPFEETDDEWRATSLVIPKYDARIVVASIDKSIRGLKHKQFRPDLIICDDLENLDIVKTQESRDKIYKWMMGDIIPMGTMDMQLVIIGTRLHDDSIISRFKREIQNNPKSGIAKSFPFLTDDNKAQWPEKFKTKEEIDSVKTSVDSHAWEREYMLNIIPSDDQVVKKEWIQSYDSLPPDVLTSNFRYAMTGVDPAISESDSADYTAMVSGRVYGRKNSLKIFILPYPINERMEFPKTIQKIKDLSRVLGNGGLAKISIEAVAFQKSIVQQLESEGYPAKEFLPQGKDKRARLALVSHLIQSGKIVFPKTGAEKLINQILNFGSEKHDDLVDAFSILVLSILEQENQSRQGYYTWIQEHLLESCYITELSYFAEKRLGIILAGGSRNYSSIILRSGKFIKVLFHEATSDIKYLSERIIEIAKSEKVPIRRTNIFIDSSGDGQELCNSLSKLILSKDIYYESRFELSFGLNLSRPLKNGKYADMRTESCYSFLEWIKDGGKLVRHSCLEDLASITYTDSGNKIKIIEKEKMLEDGIDSSIMDAIAMTFITNLESDRASYTQKPWISISNYQE